MLSEESKTRVNGFRAFRKTPRGVDRSGWDWRDRLRTGDVAEMLFSVRKTCRRKANFDTVDGDFEKTVRVFSEK